MAQYNGNTASEGVCMDRCSKRIADVVGYDICGKAIAFYLSSYASNGVATVVATSGPSDCATGTHSGGHALGDFW